MKQITLSALLFLLLGVTACKNDANKYDNMAKELCVCMTPLVELNNRIQTVAASGDTEAANKLFSTLESEFAEGRACATKLEEKYGKMTTTEDSEKSAYALKKHCPEVANLVNTIGK